jgi:16S rRNA pseudouridine516 synthase
MRLDKLLAHNGFGSRKEVKRLIRDGQVLVNGEIVTDDDYHVSELDEIELFDLNISIEDKQYFLLNKPKGCICSKDASQYPSVYEYIHENLLPDTNAFGRLDVDTEGYLIISNDGQLGHQLLSPKHHVIKGYRVTLREPFNPKYIPLIEKGITIDQNEKCEPASIEIINEKTINLLISQGKYHQVKRMMIACENEVVDLYRYQFGSIIDDGSLPVGEYRRLTEEEIELLKEA